MREGSRKDSSVWVKDQAELERKVALLYGKGHSGSGCGWRLQSYLPFKKVNPVLPYTVVTVLSPLWPHRNCLLLAGADSPEA